MDKKIKNMSTEELTSMVDRLSMKEYVSSEPKHIEDMTENELSDFFVKYPYKKDLVLNCIKNHYTTQNYDGELGKFSYDPREFTIMSIPQEHMNSRGHRMNFDHDVLIYLGDNSDIKLPSGFDDSPSDTRLPIQKHMTINEVGVKLQNFDKKERETFIRNNADNKHATMLLTELSKYNEAISREIIDIKFSKTVIKPEKENTRDNAISDIDSAKSAEHVMSLFNKF